MDFIDFDVIVKMLPNKMLTIADIVCGAGKVSTGIAEQLRERYPGYEIKVYGYDLSPQAIAVARKPRIDSPKEESPESREYHA